MGYAKLAIVETLAEGAPVGSINFQSDRLTSMLMSSDLCRAQPVLLVGSLGLGSSRPIFFPPVGGSIVPLTEWQVSPILSKEEPAPRVTAVSASSETKEKTTTLIRFANDHHLRFIKIKINNLKFDLSRTPLIVDDKIPI